MAVDGKKASGRLAAATVLWLLVAIFANQNCVHCEGEEAQQRAQQLQDTLQQQQQQDQQQRPPQLLRPIVDSMSRIENELQPGMKDMTEQTMNSDLGGSNLQQLTNGAGQLNIPGDARGPMFSGGLPMITGSQQTPTTMQTNGPPRAPNFAEPKPSQEINPNTPSMQFNLPPTGQNARRPLLQVNKQTINPPIPSNNQQNLLNNPQNPLNNPPISLNNPQSPLNNPPISLNNPQNPLNNPPMSLNNMPNPVYNQYLPQMQQRPGMGLPPHFLRFPPNHYIPGRLPMDQLAQRPYPVPYYPNGNAENGYEIQSQSLSNAPVSPDQSASSLNLGDLLQQPTAMFSNIMPSNAMQFVQKPMGMLFTTVDKLGKYTEGVKQGLGTALKGVVGTIFDETETGAKKAFELGSNGTTAFINFGRRLFVPETIRNQADSGGRYYLTQPNMQPQNYPYNHYASSPNYGGMSYNNMQYHPGTGQYAGGNNNGQFPAQHTGSQMYGPQEDSAMPYPVNPSQPIVHYGQPN